MKEARPSSPLIVPVEATHTLRFHRCMIVIFFLTQGSFYKILVCNLNEILYLLNILGTRMEVLVAFLGTRV
jgi:hypothetical protein